MRRIILYLVLACAASAQVTVNSQGRVVTGNAAFDALMGPIVPLGNSAWPWFDNRQQVDALIQIANLDTMYAAYWDVSDPGTITVTNNSAAVTGVGTDFTTRFCQGPGSPTVPKGPSVQIVVWYPISTGVTGRRMIPIASCTSDTSMTLGQIWYTDVNAGTGLGYGDTINWSPWHYSNAPANYYDNVAGFYSMYYRTGTASYLTAARKLADRWWHSPETDMGHAYSAIGSVPHGAWGEAREQALMGLFLRATELTGTASDMWAGLEEIVATQMNFTPGQNIYGYLPSVYDSREVGYRLAAISYCAMLDPTPYAATCKAYLSTVLDDGLRSGHAAGYFAQARFSDGSWRVFSGAGYGSTTSWTGSQTCAYLTHGSTAVSGLSSGCGTGTFVNTAWTSAQFVPGWPIGCTGAGCVPIPMWFVNSPTVQPASNAAGDSAVYTPTWGSATALTLDRPYEGTTGVHGWVLGTTLDNPVLGWGVSVYSLGMLSEAFHFAADALAVSDSYTSAVARGYANDASMWAATTGYRAATKSSYYNAGYVNCQSPIPETVNACTAYTDPNTSRPFSSENIRPMITSWVKTGTALFKTVAVTLFNALWAKPGTCPSGSALCVPDGYYFAQFDCIDTPPVPDAWGTNCTAPKWYGQQWGWPATTALDGYLGSGAPTLTPRWSGSKISGSQY